PPLELRPQFPNTTDRERLLLLTPALTMEGQPALAEVVEPCGTRIAFRCSPVETVSLESRVLSSIGAAAAHEGVAASAASDQECNVSRFAPVIRVFTDPPVTPRQLPPVVLRR